MYNYCGTYCWNLIFFHWWYMASSWLKGLSLMWIQFSCVYINSFLQHFGITVVWYLTLFLNCNHCHYFCCPLVFSQFHNRLQRKTQTAVFNLHCVFSIKRLVAVLGLSITWRDLNQPVKSRIRNSMATGQSPCSVEAHVCCWKLQNRLR